MNLRDYQIAARRTSSGQGITNAALGLVGEGGEVADLVKKHIYHGHALDRDRLADEIGDVLWYVAEMASEVGLELREVEACIPCDLAEDALDLAFWCAQVSSDLLEVERHELREVLRILYAMSDHIGLTLDEIADRNIAKLSARYPDGFDPARSQNREAE